MVKILKYLKSSWISILAIIALLVGQAVCDLSLPDYTSSIVNVGIQQGGITEVAPKVIRSSSMESLLLFTNSKDTKTITDSYRLIKQKDAKKNKDYKALKDEDVYELNDLTKEEKRELEKVIAKPMMLLTMVSDPKVASEMTDMILNSGQFGAMKFAEKPSLFDLLKVMPEEAKNKMFEEGLKKIDKMPEAVIDQAATLYVREEYKNVGLNINNIQTNYILITGLKMLGIALLSMTATILVGLLGSRMSARLGRSVRKNVFSKVMSFSKTELKEFSTSSLITRTTNDVQQVQMVMVMLLRVCFYAPIIGVGGVIKSMGTNSSMAWIIAVAVMSVLSIVSRLFINVIFGWFL